MKANSQNEVDRLVTKLWLTIQKNIIKVQLPEFTMTESEFRKKLSEEKKDFVITEFVMVAPDLLKKLPPHEQKIVIDIISELQQNNSLWYSDYRSIGGKYERAVLSLRKKGLLLETPFKSIHFVNPFLIRRGDIRSCLVTTWKFLKVLVEGDKKIDKHVVMKKLKPIKGAYISFFHALQMAASNDLSEDLTKLQE